MATTVERSEPRPPSGGRAPRGRRPSSARGDPAARRGALTYLVDTSVISALAPTKTDRPAALIDWLDRRSGDLFLSVVTAAEIRAGIAKAARDGARRKSETLESWWDAVEYLYGDRILP